MNYKFEFIQDSKLCEYCLKFGYTVTECRYGTCRKCNKKHNSLIHRDSYKINGEEMHTESLTSDESPVARHLRSLYDQ